MGSIFAQQTVWVNASATGANDGTSEADAYTTFTAALADINSNGDVLRVVGTIAAGSQNLSAKNFQYTIEGDTNGSTLTGTDAATRMFTISSTSVGQNVTFKNITFTGSINSTGAGGGVFYSNQPSVTLNFENCRFNGNSLALATTAGGGALWVTNSTLNITDCLFKENTALRSGGAIYIGIKTTATITRCTFYKNKTTDTNTAFGGAALYVTGASPNGPTVNAYNCTFFQNTIGHTNQAYSTIRTEGGITKVYNSLFNENKVNNGTGGPGDWGSAASLSSTITNCVGQWINGNVTNTSSNINILNTLFSSSLIYEDLDGKVNYINPSSITDVTPIDFGNDNNDVGSWDSKINLFKGTTDSDWATGSNWSSTAAPTSLENVTLLSDSPALVIGGSTNATINNLSVDASSSLTINSGGVLIVNGTSTGNVTYNRNLPSTNWYLVSAPLNGEDMTDMRANNSFATGTGSNIGFASYTPTTNQWSYFTTASTDALAAGKGFSAKLGSTGNLSFTGTINTADVSVAVSNAGTGFNLIGNPFTSHVNSASLLGDNSANLVSQTLWVWNQATSSYDTYVTRDSFVLAPAQGFFVRSSNGTNINIAESYQALTGGTFQKSSTTRTEVKLMMNDGSNNRFVKMYYLDNATKDFDNGFDGETFGGIENSVDVFTNLVENNEGKKFQVQSLPIAEMETMIVPVGVKAAAGKEITFTADAMNLPGDTKVFLEDRLTNTITRLDEANSSYKVTLNDALNGTGRFYLHTKSSGVLSTDEVVLQNTSIYAINNNTLRVVGLPSGNANVKMYNILGKQVMQTSFSSTGVKEISLPKLATGMYIVQLETAAGKLNKKIVLE
ncbi:hypothetical protein BTO13_12125 [Polaribacter gangjinensis]|uniref:Secretion system C-terminal sorting domain-containing protein n=1 Tax=Polaribacter gangjinensis TaxID=574710 RepID=A0A2S7WE84_9FLAO|nr:hypothetical protein BTO13_12125 [Polaribacter gangjinensis]